MKRIAIRRRYAWAVVIPALIITFCGGRCVAAAGVPETVQFNRDIRPILSNNCFVCHGPDGGHRKAKLRLDQPEDAMAPHENGTPVVPGDAAKSELIARISSGNPDEQMPPPKSEKKLTPDQISLLKKWIAQGGKYQKHWSLIAPVRPALPSVHDAAWPRNPIDNFILARLEAEGMKPSPEADKVTLIRRLYLELLGLPPTPKDVDQFVNDASPGAYEALVDRLLDNPHYGERMAQDWLDAARFADTHGYHIDSGRDMTAWREWVIDAFNKDMPFDQFTIEQLAGDLLPNPTASQKIATGFHRNNMVNFEGGAIPEEYAAQYVIDRVNTTGSVWLGLTVGCCQCHDHKFDPIAQKEYYQFYAFFNNVPENGLDGTKGNAQPFFPAPTPQQQSKLDELTAAISGAEQKLAGPMPELDAAQAQWERSAAQTAAAAWRVVQPVEMKAEGGATLKRQPDGSIVVSGKNPSTDTYVISAEAGTSPVTAIRLEALPDKQLTNGGPGRSENGNMVLTGIKLSAGRSTDPASQKSLALTSASADYSQPHYPVSDTIAVKEEIPGKDLSGWALYPEVGKAHAAVFSLETPFTPQGSSTISITLEFHSQFGQHQLGKFRLSLTGASDPPAAVADTLSESVRKILSIAADARTVEQKASVREYYRAEVSPVTKQLGSKLVSLRKELDEAKAKVRTTQVMQERVTPRDTFILLRGQYDKHGDKVTPGVPKSLPPLPAGAPANRLGLAEWLVSPNHPLTSRVTVNRLWQTVFGTGIVKTAEDFGSQGEPPSHPELLDWLAVEFMNPTALGAGHTQPRAWDVKAMVRLIVTSATFRQSAVATPEMIAKDPEDRLLEHSPRFRLPAEFIRDQALAISGLLNEEIGGRSVSPYQPPGLWSELMSRTDGAKWTAQVYVQDHGPDLYRRSMYTFWKRTSPPPTLSTFDAPDRETCTVRRSRTNTPLQALVVMNDPTYVEASRKVAERLLTEAPDDAARVALGFRLALARLPRPEESQVLLNILSAQRDVYRKDPGAAEKLLRVGESPRNEKLDASELASWTTVASVILNLDETMTKS